MTGHRRIIGPLAGLFVMVGMGSLVGVGSAAAQDNLDMGKTGAQLFASDCAICHKSPRGLSKTGGLFGVDSFLREHYTASRQSAAVIAAYLQSVDAAQPPPAERRRARTRKQDDKKPAENKKPVEQKPSENKPTDDKATKANASVPQSDATKTDSKPAEAKPSEAKPAEPKPVSDKKPD